METYAAILRPKMSIRHAQVHGGWDRQSPCQGTIPTRKECFHSWAAVNTIGGRYEPMSWQNGDPFQDIHAVGKLRS